MKYGQAVCHPKKGVEFSPATLSSNSLKPVGQIVASKKTIIFYM